MLTLQRMPEEIKSFIVEHGLVRSETFTDERQTDVQVALTRVIDVVMKGFAELAKQASGREVVWNAARDAKDGELASASPSTSGTMQRGGELLRSVLDDRYHGTVNSITKETGLKAASVTRLLDVVATAALEILGGLVAENHWNAQQLAEWLRPYQSASAAPLLAPASAATIMNEPTRLASPAADETATWFSRNATGLLVAVSVIAAAEFGYILNTRSNAASAEAVAASPAAPAATEPAATQPAAGQYVAVPVANISSGRVASTTKTAVPVVLKLKDGVRQIIGANSTESKLYQFLIDPAKDVDAVDPTKDWIGFDRIYFETNKAALTNESLWQLSNVASILKRFPATKVKIGGYTDSSGNPLLNLKLSKERAEATRTALISLGVPATHLTAIGYGALDNISPNDTEEGRALNRRVSMQVTQK